MSNTTLPVTGQQSKHGKYENRPSLPVTKLDRNKMQAMFLEYCRAVYGESALESCEVYQVEEFVIVQLMEQDRYGRRMHGIVGAEGVGIKQNDAAVFELWATNWTGGAVTWHVHLSRVLEEATLEETVDLAEFVRTFGDRLESNYQLWYQAATTAPTAKGKRNA